jgi:hypothetical protein
MSLRFFHIVFVTITTLLAFGCAALEWNNYRIYGGLHYIGALVSAGFGLLAIVYGIWFWNKAKRIIV